MEGIINERVCGMKMIHLERKKMTIVFKKKKKILEKLGQEKVFIFRDLWFILYKSQNHEN